MGGCETGFKGAERNKDTRKRRGNETQEEPKSNKGPKAWSTWGTVWGLIMRMAT